MLVNVIADSITEVNPQSVTFVCVGDHISAFVNAVRIQSPITRCVFNMLAAVTDLLADSDCFTIGAQAARY